MLCCELPRGLAGDPQQGEGVLCCELPPGPCRGPKDQNRGSGLELAGKGALQEPQLCASPSHLLRCQDPASFNLTLASSSLLLGGPSHSG